MEKIELNVQERGSFGKGGCRRLRKEGIIPGVVYKSGEEGVSLEIDRNDLWHALHTDAGENAIITMKISDPASGKSSERTVILQEVQVDPINNDFIHVDFHEISLKEKLQVNVPIESKGEAVGVKEDQGVLAQTLWELEVECLPADIPEHFYVHVEDLRIGDAIHVSEMEIPEGVEVLTDPEQVVISVNPPEMEEEEEEDVLGEETAEEPELIKKGKQEEEQEGEPKDEGASGEE